MIYALLQEDAVLAAKQKIVDAANEVQWTGIY